MPKKKQTTATTPGGNGISLVGAEPKATRKRATKAPKETATNSETEPATDATPEDEVCVFAVRIRRSERDLIHQVAGSGKASQFVKGIVLAAARADIDEVHRIVGEIARRK
jgi:hypothetical protein